MKTKNKVVPKDRHFMCHTKHGCKSGLWWRTYFSNAFFATLNFIVVMDIGLSADINQWVSFLCLVDIMLTSSGRN
jgi:hypothetical protein